MQRPQNRSFLIASAILLVPVTGLAQTVAAVRSEPTTVQSYDGRTMPAELVRLTVPERRAQPGRTVTVAALRLSTTAAHPGRPVVFLMGGPGIPGTVMAPIPPYFTLFQRLRESADILIVDQRGIGRSEPALDCPFDGTLPVDAFVNTDLLVAARTARKRLERAPVAVLINDQRSGQPVTLRIGREGFDAIVALNLDDARLPALLVSAAAGDDRVLTRFVETAWNGLSGGTVGLMARAVNCAADRPQARWQAVARESKSASFGTPIDNALLTDNFCRAVGYESPFVEFPGPVRSSIPALLLTGTLDATNPVENARDVAKGLSNAVMLDVENAAHEALPVPAVQDVVVDFLRGADVHGRRITTSLPHFATIAEALGASPQRGR